MNNESIHILLVEGTGGQAATTHATLKAGLPLAKLTVAHSLASARAHLNEFLPDLAIIELRLTDGTGIELLPGDPAAATYPSLVLGEDDKAKIAVAAIKAGALDYVVSSAATLADLPRIIERVFTEWAAVTERRRTEQALRESEARFRSFFESSATGMTIINPEGKPLKVNPTFCRLSGYSETEALKLNVLEVTHPDDREETQRLYADIKAGRRLVVDYEKRYLCKDGSTPWGHATIAGIFAPDGSLKGFAANVQDITESKRVEHQIRESQQMLELILDNIPQHVFWKDRNSVFLGCNRNFTTIAGVKTQQELIGKTDYDLPWKREEADFFRECDRRVMEADRPELHIIEPQLQASGKQAWLDTNKIPLHDDEGRVVGILGTFEDITERKRSEEKLREANRELDAFVYTVSHDLRTPLTPIIGYAEILQDLCRSRLDAQSLDCLAEIEGQGRRMLAILEDLLLLAKVGHLPRPAEPVDLNTVVDEILIEMGSQLAENGILVQKNELPEMWVPKTLVEQIFTNLIGNALCHAGKEGNPLEIGGKRNAEVVSLYVRDHGPGIPPEESSRIFEVFYRGERSKKKPGTGVGLATVQKIARLYGGQAWVEETPGGGSTFWVELRDSPSTDDAQFSLKSA